jgi:hypothetical protein
LVEKPTTGIKGGNTTMSSSGGDLWHVAIHQRFYRLLQLRH